MNKFEFFDAFQAALASEDEEYLEAERALVLASKSPIDFTEYIVEADPVAHALVEAVRKESLTTNSPVAAAEEYMESAEQWYAPTILGHPPVRGVVRYLSALVGDELTNFMAVRLVKVPAAPVWRAQVALSYLSNYPKPEVTEILLRYAAQTTVPTLRDATVRILKNSGDPYLATKVAAERTRLAREGRDLPPEIRQLA